MYYIKTNSAMEIILVGTASSVAQKLKNISESSKAYTSYDVNITINIIDNLLNLNTTFSDRKRIETIVDVFSNVIDSPQDALTFSSSRWIIFYVD